MDWTMIAYIAGGLLVIAAVIIAVKMPRGPATPSMLLPGNTIPDFSAVDEEGKAVSTADLRGQMTVLLFVRGNWCPFCTKQVEQLTAHYKDINDLGAKVVFVTPKPLETTRRVAEFFEVEFEFWLDDGLKIADALTIRMPDGVPKGSVAEYGPDTVWPTALIVDAEGTIRFAKLSRYLFDRPNPEALAKELRKL